MPGVYVVSAHPRDLTQDEIDLLNIEIVPLSIRFGSEEFVDRRDPSVEDFYFKMANSNHFPKRPARRPELLNRRSVMGAMPVLMRCSA